VILLNRWIRVHGANGWNEDLIDDRADLMIDALLDTWRVPTGHIGQLREDSTAPTLNVDLKVLVAAGLIAAGDVLRVRLGTHAGVEAVVLADGRVGIGDAVFDTPSGAARHVLGGQQPNGWYFWALADGRRLSDVREAYLRSATR